MVATMESVSNRFQEGMMQLIHNLASPGLASASLFSFLFSCVVLVEVDPCRRRLVGVDHFRHCSPITELLQKIIIFGRMLRNGRECIIMCALYGDLYVLGWGTGRRRRRRAANPHLH